MATKLFRYKDADYDVEIVVRSASFGDGINRVLLGRAMVEAAPKAAAVETATSAEDAVEPIAMSTMQTMQMFAESMVSTVMYPACVSATSSITNLDADKPMRLEADITAEEFINLPEDLVSDWLSAVYELNPKWRLEESKLDDLGEANEPSDSDRLTPDSSLGSSQSSAEVAL